MTHIRPALISRLYKTIDQNRSSDAILLLTQLFDGNLPDVEKRDENFLASLRQLGEQLQAQGQVEDAEELYVLAIALYDRFFSNNHVEGIASARRAAELLAMQNQEAELGLMLDYAYAIIQRIDGAAQAYPSAYSEVGSIADSLARRAHTIMARRAFSSNVRSVAADGTGRPLRVLIVEDDPDAAQLVTDVLTEDEPDIITEWTDHLHDGIRRLSQGNIDVVLLDLTLPDSQALETLLKVRARAPHVPVVVLTAVDDRELALKALKTGARDFLIKGEADPPTLKRSIRLAVEQHCDDGGADLAFRFIEHNPLPMLHLSSSDMKITAINSAMEALVRGQWVGQPITEIWPQFSLERLLTNSERGSIQLSNLDLPTPHKHTQVDVLVWPADVPGSGFDGLFIQCSPAKDVPTKRKSVATQFLLEAVEEGEKQQKVLRSRVSQQTALARVNRLAQTEQDISLLLSFAAEQTAIALGADHCFILRKQESAAQLSAGTNVDREQRDAVVTAYKLGSEYWSSMPELLILRKDSAPGEIQPLLTPFECELGAMGAIRGPLGTHGLMVVGYNEEHELTEEDKAFIEALCGSVATALERCVVAEQLAEATTELKRSNTDLQQFAYAAAHDLQEPLRSIVSYLELLSKHLGDDLDEKGQKYMQISSNAGKRMQALINDLLQYSRVGSKAASAQIVDTQEILDYVIADLDETIKGSDASIEAEALPVVLGDPSQIAQVFRNLIGNAIKFKTDAPPRIRIRAEGRPNNNFWLFSIKDNGIGMEMQYAERIFVIFQRLHTRNKYPGTGIGLALCKRIIERHGGRIWVESEPDKGTTFFFTLPRVLEPSEDE